MLLRILGALPLSAFGPALLLVAALGAVARAERAPPPTSESAGAATIGKVDATRGQVRRELAQARDARDVVRAVCLNDKLAQVDVARRVILERLGLLSAAKSTEERSHEQAMLTVLSKRVELLGAEASACIGSEMAFVDTSQVTTSGQPGPPGEIAAFPPPPDLDIVTMPPVEASPSGR